MDRSRKIISWLASRKKKIFFSVKKKKISELKKWIITNNEVYHNSRKFFRILGIEVKSNFYKNKNWDQPVIHQNEKGILGILRRNYRDNIEYLMQAKMEPGNINKLQLSPTVQATKSNYQRVHKGKKVPYLSFFKNNKKFPFLVNSLQSEQGGRYLFKFNKNIMVNTDQNIKLDPNYIWISKQEISKLIKKNNLLNMDSISVFSCSIKKNLNDLPQHSLYYLENWFKKLKKKYFIKRKVIPLSKIKNWYFNKRSIYHKSKKYFSIIGIKIASNSREISEWEQPIVQEMKLGLSGFLTKKMNSAYHYLVRFSLEPGLKNPGLTCTVRTSDVKNCLKNNNYADLKDSNLVRYYLKKYFIGNANGKIIYNKIQSDEGGRFFHSQSKNIIVQIDEKEKIKLNQNYIWMSHNQILHFIQKGLFNIEARILFTCLNVKNIL